MALYNRPCPIVVVESDRDFALIAAAGGAEIDG
jgi:hypothetical protein